MASHEGVARFMDSAQLKPREKPKGEEMVWVPSLFQNHSALTTVVAVREVEDEFARVLSACFYRNPIPLNHCRVDHGRLSTQRSPQQCPVVGAYIGGFPGFRGVSGFSGRGVLKYVCTAHGNLLSCRRSSAMG